MHQSYISGINCDRGSLSTATNGRYKRFLIGDFYRFIHWLCDKNIGECSCLNGGHVYLINICIVTGQLQHLLIGKMV